MPPEAITNFAPISRATRAPSSARIDAARAEHTDDLPAAAVCARAAAEDDDRRGAACLLDGFHLRQAMREAPRQGVRPERRGHQPEKHDRGDTR